MTIPFLRRRMDALLVMVDAVAAVLACAVAYLLRFEGVHVPADLVRRYAAASIAVAATWVVAARLAGLYRRAALRVGVPLVEESFGAAVGVGVALAGANALLLDGELSRAWIGLVLLGLLLAGVGSRSVLRRARRGLVPFGLLLERYAIVGDDANALRLQRDLTRAQGAPFEIVELVPTGTPPEQLAVHATALRLDGLLVPDAALSSEEIGRLASAVSGAGIDVLLAPSVGGLEMRVSNFVTMHGVPLLRAAGVAPRRRAVRRPPSGRVAQGVAILGTRGIPANYGGFETFAQHLAEHVVHAGIPVTVYCRSHYATGATEFGGVRLVTLPTVRHKYFDTVVHTAVSVLHLVTRTRIREVVLCNAANAPLLPILRLARRRVVLNVDGLEWRRGKWGVLGRSWYRLGEWLSVRFASVLVTDAEEVRTYYRVRHDSDSVMIPYGAELLARGERELPDTVPVTPDSYVLYVSRWEAENNPRMVAAAHAASGVGLQLVMLGKATYDEAIEDDVHRLAAPSAIFPGGLYGDAYLALQANARCYVHATEVGGTHPALIEALGAGNLCLVLDTPENREVAGDHAWYFADADSLADCLRRVEALDRGALAACRDRARAYARQRYSWESVGRSYLELLGA